MTRPDPDLQAPRRLLPLALALHRALRQEQPVAGREGRCRARDLPTPAARHGLQFGVYLSPWDRNHAGVRPPAYIEYYRNQLRELLTQYGPLFEVWFDGANGGDGYLRRRARTPPDRPADYYDWDETWQIVRELQPDACMFSDAGPDIRWVGNEAGIAGDPCWATHEPRRTSARARPIPRAAATGATAPAPTGCPPNATSRSGPAGSITPQRTSGSPPENLLDLYFKSVGRGASFLLNLPPDRRGRIHPTDARNLIEFNRRIEQIFAHNLALVATNVIGPDTRR